MRVALAVAAALALAACQVDVEGAQCSAFGSTEQCPTGQACGNDGRCSELAARCAASCKADAVRCSADRGAVETCSVATDAVCGTWVRTGGGCEDAGLVCDPASPRCVHFECSEPGAGSPPCPPGQACGNDLHCSGEAAECASRCTPTERRCGGPHGTERVEICTPADEICGAWEPSPSPSCAEQGLTCAAPGEGPACVPVPCDAPGYADGCPAGQACGNDRVCSLAAASCAPRCTPGEQRCSAGSASIERCTSEDAVCGKWVADEPCSAIGLTCSASAGAPACVPVPCSTPGDVDGCPAEQACGNDHVCSAAALACRSTRCTPGDQRCGGVDRKERIEVCSGAVDAVCGRWEPSRPCVEEGLTCTGSGDATACVPVPCRTPGSASECPSGQACGNDLNCSPLVATCVAEGTFCVAGVERRCHDNGREQCEPGAPCGAWTLVEACGALVCDAASFACICAAPPPSELYVDVGAGGTGPGVVPNGTQSPPECRLPSIPVALAIATGGTTVHVVGAAATYQGPFHVGKGVALVADDAPLAPASRVLDDSETSGGGVTLEEGARLAGFTVRAAAGDPRPAAVHVACAAPAKVTLEKVVVDAAPNGSHAVGVQLTGACDVDLSDVHVVAATTTGVDVGMDPATAIVRMTGGRVERCGTGIVLTRGDLRLDGTTVVGSAGTGVVAGDGMQDTQFTATNALFANNGDTAIELAGNTHVDLENDRICQNRAKTPRGNTSARLVGGIWAHGRAPSGGIVFRGNEVHHNAADQVLVQATQDVWSLDGGSDATACTAGRNLFLGYDAGTGRGVVAANANVSARWNAWQSITPTAGSDFEAFGVATVDAGLTSSRFCDDVYTPRPCE